MLYIALIALVAGVFGACTTDFKPGPQAPGPQVSFLMNNPTTVEFTGAEGEEVQRLTLSRYNTDEDLSVYILANMAKEDAHLFDIPKFVEFKAGEATAELVMTIDHAKFQNDKTYTVGFYIDETVTTPYGCAEWTVNFALNPWELMTDDKGNNAKGKFRGGAALDYIFKIDTNLEINVDIYKHKSKPGVYKIADPWTPTLAYGFGYPSIEDALADGLSTTNAGLIFDASNPDAVIIEEQSMGIDIGYGEMFVFTGYPIYVTDPAAGAGSMVDGVITFPVKTGLLFYSEGINEELGQNPTAVLYANTSGSFRIVLPGVELADYSLAVAYDGMDVAADNKTTTAKFKFSYGADVTGINYMIVAGNQEDQASALLSTLVAGTDENILSVENFEVGKGEANVKVGLESGLYTIVAAPADKNGALRSKEALVQSFYFAGMGNTEEHPCEVGVITTKFSIAYPSYAAQYPDYSALAYCVYGTGIKSAKYLVAATATFEYYAAQGVDTIALINEYGSDIKAEYLSMVNSDNGWVSNAINLDAATEYTIAVYATNEYGESALATATHTTDAAPEYTGELVIGNYSMYCKYEDEEGVMESSSVFNVASNGGSHTDFIVTNFGVQSSYPWNAKYDSAAGTLTLDGTINGQGNRSYFGDWYLYYSQANNTIFGLFSVNGPESAGNDPVVLTVDPATKQISGLATTMVEVLVVDGSNGAPLYDALFVGGLTQIAPYVEAQKQSATLNPVYVPLRNANAVRNTLYKKPNIEIGAVEKIKNSVSLEASAAWKTSSKCVKSVKPSVVETYTSEKTKGVKFAKVNEVAFRR